MKNTLEKLLKTLTDRDINALKSIYDFRGLSLSQIYELHYMKSIKNEQGVVSDNYCRKKMSAFVSAGFLEKVSNGVLELYFLTSPGIDFIKSRFDLPANIYDPKKQVVKRGYYRASELKIAPKFLNHQYHLNQFMIKFKNMELDIPYRYYDEKHISTFRGIRPDGLLNMLDTDFFIEIDMSTESQKQLSEKWDNYRHFLN